jgi:ATP-dependent Clp protease ATP-binding subunit ClpB
MTSNLGSHRIQQMADEGSEQALIKIAVMAEVKQHFRPEFVNRIDEIVVFSPLDQANIASIARIQLRRASRIACASSRSSSTSRTTR